MLEVRRCAFVYSEQSQHCSALLSSVPKSKIARDTFSHTNQTILKRSTMAYTIPNLYTPSPFSHTYDDHKGLENPLNTFVMSVGMAIFSQFILRLWWFALRLHSAKRSLTSFVIVDEFETQVFHHFQLQFSNHFSLSKSTLEFPWKQGSYLKRRKMLNNSVIF